MLFDRLKVVKHILKFVTTHKQFMYLSLLYFLFSANACIESSIKFIMFESSNSIFLPDTISNI